MSTLKSTEKNQKKGDKKSEKTSSEVNLFVFGVELLVIKNEGRVANFGTHVEEFLLSTVFGVFVKPVGVAEERSEHVLHFRCQVGCLWTGE